MKLDSVRTHFEQKAFDYDGLIPRLIPRYGEQHNLILQLIPFDSNANLKVLDLGALTGILSALILQAFPQANVTAFDMAENMLKVCQTNLSAFRDRLILQRGNFAEDDRIWFQKYLEEDIPSSVEEQT